MGGNMLAFSAELECRSWPIELREGEASAEIVVQDKGKTGRARRELNEIFGSASLP
jgi:hypothetical protein